MLGGGRSTERKKQELMRRQTLRRRDELAESGNEDDAEQRRRPALARRRRHRGAEAEARQPTRDTADGPGHHRNGRLHKVQFDSERPGSSFTGLNEVRRNDSVIEMSDEPSFVTDSDVRRSHNRHGAGDQKGVLKPAMLWLPKEEASPPGAWTGPASTGARAPADTVDRANGGGDSDMARRRQRRSVQGGILLEESLL